MISTIHTSKNWFALFSGLFIILLAAAVITGQTALVIIPFALLFMYAGWYYKQVVFYLLLVALPFSFEYQLASGLGTDIPDEFLMIFVSFLFFGYWLWSPKTISKRVWQHPLFVVLLIVSLWMLVAVLFSHDKMISFKFLLAKSWYAGAFIIAPLIMFRDKRSLVIAFGGLVMAMMLVVVIALLRHSTDGFSFAGINEAVAPFFRNHVNYSAMLVCCIPVLAAFWSMARSKQVKLFLLFILLIALSALFFSYARGAWVALLAGIAAYWLTRKRLLFFSYIFFVVVATSSLFWLKKNDRYLRYAHDYSTTIFHKDFNEHLIATYKLKDVSTAERFYRWIAGVRMIRDNWLTGYGPGTFYDNYKPYTVPAFKTWVSDNIEKSTVHNYFLLTAIEQGVPGLVFFLVLLGAMFYYAQQLYHRVNDIFYRTVAITTGVVLSMIVVVNFLSDLVETDKIGSLFFLCLSVLVVTDINTRKSESSPDVQGVP